MKINCNVFFQKRVFLLVLLALPLLLLVGCSDTGYTPSYIISNHIEEERVEEAAQPK